MEVLKSLSLMVSDVKEGGKELWLLPSFSVHQMQSGPPVPGIPVGQESLGKEVVGKEGSHSASCKSNQKTV